MDGRVSINHRSRRLQKRAMMRMAESVRVPERREASSAIFRSGPMIWMLWSGSYWKNKKAPGGAIEEFAVRAMYTTRC